MQCWTLMVLAQQVLVSCPGQVLEQQRRRLHRPFFLVHDSMR
jgi:hypothetical protein